MKITRTLIAFLILVFAGNAWGQNTYKLITSTTDLVAGEIYLIGSSNTTSTQLLGYQNSNNRPQATGGAYTITSGTIPATIATATGDLTKPYEIVLGGSTGLWTLFDPLYNGYLYAASTSNNYLRTQTTSTTWTITFSSGAAIMTSANVASRNILQYNSTSSLFSCYTSGQISPFLYRRAYTVKYLGNSNTGGTAPTDATSPYFSGATVTVKANTGTLVRTGYTFSGWNTKADGSGTDYAATGSVTYTKTAVNDTLYAKWTSAASSYSGVTAGAGTEPSTLSSLTTALTGASAPQQNAVLNFDFLVTDDANTTSGDDALPTLITQIVLPQGTGNDIADWTQAIQGAELSDGTNTLTGTVAATSITFSSISTGSGALGNISDGGTKTYTLKIWLKTALGGALPTTIDGLNLAFKIDRTNFTTASSASSTQFESGAGTAVESGSTNNAVAVVATKLNFVAQPTNVNQNATMSPSVTISANDPNNNRDLGYTSNVLLASTGTMTGAPITVAASAGLATYSGVVHTVAGTGLVLTGTSGALTATGNSSSFNVIALTPTISVTGYAHNSTFAYGSKEWGSNTDQTFTINNTGTAAMTISSLTFGGSGFALQGAAPTTVAVGGTATFTVRFTPNAIGAFAGSITINNNSSNQTAYVVNFTGTGAPNTLSTITTDATYIPTSNVLYATFQSTPVPSSAASSVGVHNIIITDGADADNLPTILNTLNYTYTGTANTVRAAALFTTSNTKIADATTIGANSIAFTGLSGASVTAADGGTVQMILRVTFTTSVTDNEKLVFTVSGATAAASNTSSLFTSFAAVSDNSGANDRNRIEVVATKLTISTIADGNVGINLPSFTVSAQDANNKTDLDRTENVALTTSGTGMTSSSPYALTSGSVTISDVQYGAAQSGINLTGTVSSPSLTGTSNNFNITVVTASVGDYRTNPALGNSGTVFFSSTTAISGVRPWQTWNGSAWVDVTGSSATASPEFVSTVPPNIYVISGGYIDVAGGRAYNNIQIDLPSSSIYIFSGNTTTGLTIATGKTLDIKKGKLDLSGKLDLQGTAQMIVRTGAEIYISSASSNFIRSTSSTWEVENGGYVFVNSYIANAWTGTEIFHEDSYFDITDWSDANPLFTGTGSSIVSTTTVSGYSAMFGHLYIEIPSGGLTANWTGVLPSGISGNLTHGDFLITNNDANNISLYTGNTSTIRVGNNMIVDGTGNVQMQAGAGSLTFTVDGNLTKNGSGNYRIHPYGSSSSGNDLVLNVDGNIDINAGFFYFSTTSSGGPSTVINLKGNLYKAAAAYLTNSNSSGYTNDALNFTGSGTTQTIDVATQSTNDFMRTRLFVKGGAYVQLINRDLNFGTSSGITVEDLGTLDFGFNGSSTTGWIMGIAGSNTGTYFTSNQGSTLKITHLQGISTTGSIGNVQVLAGNRSFSQVATFWYIGRDNQVTGNGINTTSTAKIIICDLVDNTKQLTFTNSTGITATTTISATGGKLDIRKGQVIESTTAYITGSTGTLYMSPGTLYYVPVGYSTLTTESGSSGGTYIPRLLGSAFSYNLTGGTIELAGTGASHVFQTLRGGRTYKNIKYSGANSTYSYPTLTDYKNLSSNTIIDSALIITNGAIVDCIDNSAGPVYFRGPGGLTMSGSGSRMRMKSLNETLPLLAGYTSPYNLTGGTVEWYGTSSSQTHSLRGTDSNSVNINYFNVDINSTGANVGALGANVVAGAGFGVAGTMNVNSPACFQLGSGFTITDAGTSTFEVKPGATFKYGGSIATSGATGNVRTDTRTFPTTASYGFVGSVTPQDPGTGLPSSMVNMYVDKSDTGKLVTITKSEEVTNTLSFYKGIVKTNSDTLYVSNTSTTAITGGNTSGSDKYVQGRLKRKTDGASTYTFPIGHSTQNAQGFTITPTGTSGSDLLGYLETNSTTPVKTVAYCDLETKTAAGQQIGQGTAGADGALDQIVFNLASPLQWDITNPGGGVSSYNVTVLGNGGQDISPVTSAGGTAVRYLLKNGEPGNTGFATGSGGADYPTVGFLACPNQYTLTGMTSFSKFTLNGANPSGTGLPVKLLFFTGRKVENYSQLDWATAIEIDNDKFIVERSTDAIQFEAIDSVKGAGNTTVQQNYQWLDKSPLSGWNYYRLKQVDFDGDVEYTNTVAVNFDGDETTPSIIVFPSPSKDFINVQILGTNQIVEAVLYNMIGQAVKNVTPNERMSIEDLPSGEYFIKVIMGNNVVVKQFVKE